MTFQKKVMHDWHVRRRYCGPQREFLPAHHSDGDVFVNLQLSDGRQTLLLIRGRWDSMPHSLMSSSVIFGIGR
jgi:hypothetical protein